MAASISGSSSRRPPYLYAILLAGIGAILIFGGVKLAALGGSPYYFLAGLSVVASAALLWRGRRQGAWVFAAMLVATVFWALWESGLDGWALAPRLVAPFVIGSWMARPGFGAALRPRPRNTGVVRYANAGGFLGAVIAAAGLGLVAHQLQPKEIDPAFTVAMSPPFRADATPASALTPAAQDWATYNADPGGSHYSALVQLTPQNVARLKVAWTYHIGMARADHDETLEVNPLKIGDLVYLCTGGDAVVALDAETGRQRWRYDAHINWAGLTHATCRGVAYFKPKVAAGDCAERIILATGDARLIALDAHTGAACQSFGLKGQVSLLTGMGQKTPGYYHITSAPTLARGKIVIGGWVTDNQYWGEPSGVIRAYDATTGQFAWAFDIGRPDDHKEPARGRTYTLATPNSWAPMSADDTLGLVYVPTGNATPDYYAARRRPIDDKISSAVMALDTETGALRWVFQTTHHDIWDYDVASQPNLVDLPAPRNGVMANGAMAGGVTHALVQPTKRGEVFVLDRVTGRPITTVAETPVPTRGVVPNERPSPTQPFSVGMPSFGGPVLREDMMWGLTPIDQMLCRIRFRKARYDGPMTPPGLKPIIDYPSNFGGSDWGGASIDPVRHLMIISSNRLANTIELLPRAQADRRGIAPASLRSKTVLDAGGAQAGTPYAAIVGPFVSPLGTPCQQPPYGMLSAVNLATHKVVWSYPLGTARDIGPLGRPSMIPLRLGTPTLGGAITTASGLVFIGATQEKNFRAIDTATGEILWSMRLPASNLATPTTYLSPASGRQFVVIAAGGNSRIPGGVSDAIIAYALPKP